MDPRDITGVQDEDALDVHRDLLDQTLVGAEDGPAPDSPAYAPGSTVGRYVILQEVGCGGMGIVFAAFDPQLNRKIALKILHPCRNGTDKKEGPARTRLMREAQAIAKLSHPNVISVFDVGVVDDAVFVAMEFIEGQTLSRWLAIHQPSPGDIVDVFVQAGRGLAAAHSAGLVHRDFKPDNVLVASQGQVRVSDFGLACVDASGGGGGWPASHEHTLAERRDPVDHSLLTPPEPAGVPLFVERSDTDVLSSSLTQDGAIVGTPRYMAPEQHRGVGTDARSDQFSFCVALYQALYGRDPYSAATVEGTVAAKQEGRIRQIPTSSRVPLYLEAIVLRGLSADPDQRFPSMEILVEELCRDPAVLRRRIAAGAVVALAIGTTAAMAGYHQAPAAHGCEDAAERLQGIWDPARKREVRNALAAIGDGASSQVWAEVEHNLDTYAAKWTNAHTRACVAASLGGQEAGTLFDLSIVCLHRARGALDALAGVLQTADEDMVGRAVQATSGLPPLDPCSSAEYLLAGVAPVHEQVNTGQVAEVRAQLDKSEALRAAGKYAQALAKARQWVEAARATGHTPLYAEAQYVLGRALEKNGAYVEAEDALAEAVWAATRSQHDEYAARAATQLVGVVGDRLARHAEGLRWAEHARSLLDRIGLDGIARAQLDNIAGNVMYRKGDLDEAKNHYEAAISTRQALRGQDDPDLAGLYVNLGNVLYSQGRRDAAVAMFEHGLAQAQRTMGADHPVAATADASVGVVMQDLDRFDDAEIHFSRALEVFRRTVGDRHPFVAATLGNLGLTDESRQRYELAAHRYREAMQIYAQTVGPNHPDYARMLHNLGRSLRRTNDHEAARQHLERAFAIRREILDDQHVDVGASTHELAELDLAQGRSELSVEKFERALAIYRAGAVDRRALAEVRFGLARALSERGRTGEARAMAQRARAALVGEGTRGATLRGEIEAWLESSGSELKDLPSP